MPESGFGPLSTPPIEYSKKEYNKRFKEYESESLSSDELYKLALIAFEIGEDDLAFSLFSKLVGAEFNSPYFQGTIIFYLGKIEQRRGNFEQAKIFIVEHGDPYYIHQLDAAIYRKNGQLEKAEHEYLLAQSVRLYEMHNYETYQDLAEMFYEEKDYAKAEHYISRFIACAEWEMEPFNSAGYTPPDHEHILKARQFLSKIKKTGKQDF